MDKLFTEEWDAMPGMRVRLLVGADEAARLHAVGKDDYPVDDALAITVPCDGGSAVVLDPEKLGGCELHEVLGILAHEAYHCTTNLFEGIGELEPAREEVAYYVQSAATGLFEQFFDWLGCA